MIDYTISVLSTLLVSLPIGTNLALLHFMWMLVSGALLPHRGAIFPALKSTGLSDAATRRAWAAFRKGVWQIALFCWVCGVNMSKRCRTGSSGATKGICR